MIPREPHPQRSSTRNRPGETALRLERLRAFAGRPAVHQVSWIRQPHAELIRGRDFTAVSLYAALADAGVAVARASETIRTERAATGLSLTWGATG